MSPRPIITGLPPRAPFFGFPESPMTAFYAHDRLVVAASCSARTNSVGVSPHAHPKQVRAGGISQHLRVHKPCLPVIREAEAVKINNIVIFRHKERELTRKRGVPYLITRVKLL